jgi:hypothetical protein
MSKFIRLVLYWVVNANSKKLIHSYIIHCSSKASENEKIAQSIRTLEMKDDEVKIFCNINVDLLFDFALDGADCAARLKKVYDYFCPLKSRSFVKSFVQTFLQQSHGVQMKHVNEEALNKVVDKKLEKEAEQENNREEEIRKPKVFDPVEVREQVAKKEETMRKVAEQKESARKLLKRKNTNPKALF